MHLVNLLSECALAKDSKKHWHPEEATTWAHITMALSLFSASWTLPPPHPPQLLGVGNSGIGASSSDSSPAACRAALALAAARNSKSMAVARAESEGNSPELPWFLRVLRFTFFRGVSRGSIFVDLEPCFTVFKVDVVSGTSRASLFASSNVDFCFAGFFFSTFFTFFAFFTLEVLESSDAFSNAARFFFGTRLASQLFGLRSASSLVNFARKASAMFARLERMAASKDFWQAWATSEVEKCQQHPANLEWS